MSKSEAATIIKGGILASSIVLSTYFGGTALWNNHQNETQREQKRLFSELRAHCYKAFRVQEEQMDSLLYPANNAPEMSVSFRKTFITSKNGRLLECVIDQNEHQAQDPVVTANILSNI